MKKLILISLIVSTFCSAEIFLSVTGAGVRRAKIAVGDVRPLPDYGNPDPSLAAQIRTQLLSDLEFINIFEFIPDSTAHEIDKAQELYAMNYEKWSPTGASFVLRVGYKVSSGKLLIEGMLYDVPGQKKVFGTRYQYALPNYSRVVHALSEDILKSLTGEKGLFSSRILMVCSDITRRYAPPKDVFLIDADGKNLIQLTNDNTLSLSPAWMNNNQEISYTQFEFVIARGNRKRGTVLKKHNLNTGARSILSSRDGMNSGAAWSPNGNRGVATLSFTGKPELYFINPNGGGEPQPLSRNIQWKSLTGAGFQSNNINQLFDVEANWAPDGQHLVFSSARTGHPMIYTVDLNTNIANQLTFAGQYNASPSWSPKGDKLLFAAQRTGEGNFDIYMIDPDGNNLSRITVGDRPGRKINHENPSWAPTGRHFAMASNDTGNYAVYITTADGLIKRKISPEGKECKSPAWSQAE